jgi:DNA-binding transcriptional MocR family regulator
MAEELKYRRIAQHLEQLISIGTLRPGDRLPSVRGICRAEKVSPASAIQALMTLEAKGLICARPRSGFYVESRFQLPSPSTPKIAIEPMKVRYKDTVTIQVWNNNARLDIVPLGACLPDPSFLPEADLTKSAVRVARLHPRTATRYDTRGDDQPLRLEVAKRLARSGCEVSPNEVVITHGCTHALNLALRAVAAPGDLVAVENPSFFGLPEVLSSYGLRVLPVPSLPESGISLDALESALARFPIKALVLTPNFTNPTGAILSPNARARLSKMLQKNGVPLIEDDVFRELAHDGCVPPPIKAGLHRDQTILCGSFSKILCPGWRIGWAVPGRYTESVLELKAVTTMHTPLLPALVGAEFLREGLFDRHLRRFRQRISQQMCRLADAVGRHFPDGTAVTRPRGGFLLWVELPHAIDASTLAATACDLGIGIAPGALFSSTEGFRSFIRLNTARHWSAEIDKAIETLGTLATRQVASSVRPAPLTAAVV